MYFAIVDDLESDREKLKKLISEDSHIGKNVEFLLFSSGEEFLSNYRLGLCQAVFLDVVMGGISGVEVARKIRQTDSRIPIILTTTEKEFALDAFSVHVMDYLVKPLDSKKLAWCLEKLNEYVKEPSYLEVKEISEKGITRQSKISPDDILYLYSSGHHVMIQTISGEVRVRIPFRELFLKLPQNGRFFVCGRCVAVNFSYVKSVEDGEIILKNGVNLQFSKRQQSTVEQAYHGYIFSRTRKGGWV